MSQDCILGKDRENKLTIGKGTLWLLKLWENSRNRIV